MLRVLNGGENGGRLLELSSRRPESFGGSGKPRCAGEVRHYDGTRTPRLLAAKSVPYMRVFLGARPGRRPSTRLTPLTPFTSKPIDKFFKFSMLQSNTKHLDTLDYVK